MCASMPNDHGLPGMTPSGPEVGALPSNPATLALLDTAGLVAYIVASTIVPPYLAVMCVCSCRQSLLLGSERPCQPYSSLRLMQNHRN